MSSGSVRWKKKLASRRRKGQMLTRKVNETPHRFRELLLDELPGAAEHGDSLAEFSLKHGV
jgi:hypothetical protein